MTGNKIVTGNIPELTSMEVTYETCAGGQNQETVYIVTDDDYGHKHEASIGYILMRDRFASFEVHPIHFGFDGLIYPTRITEEKVIEIIGAEMLELHKTQMRALEVIWNFDLRQEGLSRQIKGDMLPNVECVDCGAEMPLTPEVEMLKEKDDYVCNRCSFGRSL